MDRTEEAVSRDAIPPFVAERIVLGLRARGVSQRQLAEELRVGEASVSRWLRRRARMPMRGLQHVARRLNVTVADLFAAPIPAPSPDAALRPDGGKLSVLPGSESAGYETLDSHVGAAPHGAAAGNGNRRAGTIRLMPAPQVFVSMDVEAQLNAGVPGEVRGETLTLPYELVAGRNLRLMEAVGQCMEPRISAGDYVLIDVDARPDDNDVVAARVETAQGEQWVLKHYLRLPDGKIALFPALNVPGVGRRYELDEADVHIQGVLYAVIHVVGRRAAEVTWTAPAAAP